MEIIRQLKKILFAIFHKERKEILVDKVCHVKGHGKTKPYCQFKKTVFGLKGISFYLL